MMKMPPPKTLQHHYCGMTLIELVATLGILGILMAFAVPPFRSIQGRQSLRIAQRNVASALTRMQQLVLAPQANDGQIGVTYDIVGYGLIIANKPKVGGTLPRLGSCSIDPLPNNDFLAVVKFVKMRSSDGEIRVVPNGANPDSCGTINPKRYPNDFYILPNNVHMSPNSLTENSAWLLAMPMYAAGQSFGELTAPGYLNPLPASDSTQSLQLYHESIRVDGKPICQAIDFARNSNGITMNQGIVRGGCT